MHRASRSPRRPRPPSTSQRGVDRAMARITIDGKEYEVDGTDNLLKIALSKGYDLPYFCWHPELHSVGACRQCAVTQYKDEDDNQGQIVMACMTPAAEGTRI